MSAQTGRHKCGGTEGDTGLHWQPALQAGSVGGCVLEGVREGCVGDQHGKVVQVGRCVFEGFDLEFGPNGRTLEQQMRSGLHVSSEKVPKGVHTYQ
eukprot:355500-Pelagomonas_calceolata.AAC.1